MKKNDQEKKRSAAPIRATQENVESFYGRLGISKMVKDRGTVGLFEDFYTPVRMSTNSRD